MFIFTFNAVDAFGSRQTVEVRAVTVEEAIASLKKEGLRADKSHMLGAERDVWWSRLKSLKSQPLFSGIPPKELLRFIKLLGSSLSRGRTIKESLEFLEENEDHRALRKMLQGLRERLNKPFKSQVEVFSLYPQHFDEAFLGIVRAGESSGHLGQYFLDYAQEKKAQLALADQFKTVLLSRLATFLLVLAVAGVVVAFVIPQFSQLFGDALQIPFPMRVLLGVSSFFRRFGVAVFLIALLGSGSFFYLITQHEKSRWVWHDFLLRMPVLGKTLRTYHTAQFAYLLSTLLSKNVGIVSAMEILIRQCPNVCLKATYRSLLDSMKSGADLFAAIVKESEKGFGYLIPSIVQAAKMGSATASLGAVLLDVRKDLDELFTLRLERAIKAFSRIFYAFVIALAVFIAYAVGSAVVAFYDNAQNLL